MNDSLLIVIIPVLVILVIIILCFVIQNGKLKRIERQLEDLEASAEFCGLPEGDDLPVVEEVTEEPAVTEYESKDAFEEEEIKEEASGYNTGKSGKIYTKEELELLIKE